MSYSVVEESFGISLESLIEWKLYEYIKVWYCAPSDMRSVGTKASSIMKHTHLFILLVVEVEMGERERKRI